MCDKIRDPSERWLRSTRLVWCFVFASASASRTLQSRGSGLDRASLGQAALAGWFLVGGILRFHLAGVDTVLFVGLACYSAWMASVGKPSCGCFGLVPVSPWYSFAFCATAAMLSSAGDVVSRSSSVSYRPARFGRLYFVAASLNSIAFLGIVGAGHLRPMMPAVVSQDPGDWVDRDLPLADWVDIGPELRRGDWLVILHRRGCPLCQRVIDRIPARPSASGDRRRVAIVEVPSPDPSPPLVEDELSRSVLVGKLSDTKYWTFETPVVLTLSGGRVLSVRGPESLERGLRHLR